MSKICRTFAADLERNIMKAMYKQPKTEIAAFETELMQGLATMSPTTGGGGGGGTEAPARRMGGEVID